MHPPWTDSNTQILMGTELLFPGTVLCSKRVLVECFMSEQNSSIWLYTGTLLGLQVRPTKSEYLLVGLDTDFLTPQVTLMCSLS